MFLLQFYFIAVCVVASTSHIWEVSLKLLSDHFAPILSKYLSQITYPPIKVRTMNELPDSLLFDANKAALGRGLGVGWSTKPVPRVST